MSDMNVRSDAVDVEQIMQQIRARIREKRGADYTENELQQMASVKLEKFVDPKGLRSNLVGEYRRSRVMPPPLTPKPPDVDLRLDLDADLDRDPQIDLRFEGDIALDLDVVVDENTLYETHRAPLQMSRKALRPILKLFFNPDRLTTVLHKLATGLHGLLHEMKTAFQTLRHNIIVALQEHSAVIREHGVALRQATAAVQKLRTGLEHVTQSQVNVVQVSGQLESRLRRFESQEPLSFELLHNLTTELTRLGIENHNLKMRVESLSSRLDFDERRSKALEGVVQYRPVAERSPAPRDEPAPDSSGTPPAVPGVAGVAGVADAGSRRRRRRRRRRPGRTMADGQTPRPWSDESAEPGAAEERDEDGPADGAQVRSATDEVRGDDNRTDDEGPDTRESDPDTTPQ